MSGWRPGLAQRGKPVGAEEVLTACKGLPRQSSGRENGEEGIIIIFFFVKKIHQTQKKCTNSPESKELTEPDFYS